MLSYGNVPVICCNGLGAYGAAGCINAYRSRLANILSIKE